MIANEALHNKTNSGWNPKIVVFVCSWCGRAGADLAGIAGLQCPVGVRIIRVPCAGRVDPYLVVKTFQSGGDGVLVCGCHPGDCHHLSGNLVARRRLTILKGMLEFIDIEKERFQVAWISGLEGAKFARLLREISEKLKVLGPNRRFVKEIQNANR